MKTLLVRVGVGCAFCGVLIGASGARAESAPGLKIRTGETITFLGDSITAYGSAPLGYISRVVSGLAANGVTIKATPMGTSGEKSDGMLAKVDGLLSQKPDWLSVSCGVNDVMHGANGVPLDAYKKNMRAIVEKAQAAKVKVLLLTPTMIGEDPTNANNRTLAAYTVFLRELASEKECLLADLNAQMQGAVAAAVKAGRKPGTLFTVDGVHMNVDGNAVMGIGVLKALGMSPAQLDKAEKVWEDVPNGVALTPTCVMSLRKYRKLEAVAAGQKKSVNEYLNAELAKIVADVK